MKKKNNFIKILSFILCLVMLAGCFAFTASAQEEEYTAVEWSLDEDLEYINGNHKRYKRYYVKGAFYSDAINKFSFMNEVAYKDTYCQVFGDSAYPHIVWVKKPDNYNLVFTDATGRDILDSFIAGTDCVYYLERFDQSDYATLYAKIGDNVVELLNEKYGKAEDLEWIDVTELGESEIFEITVHDKTESKAYQHGAIYIMPDGRYYYLCFDGLDNSHFDADGYFSYRWGNVQVLELDEFTRARVDECASSMVYKEYNTVYENYVVNGYCDIYGNPIKSEEDPKSRVLYIILFYVSGIILGIVFPAVLLILGLSLEKSEKTGMARCWRVMSAASAVWILFATLFLLFVIL